MINENPCEFCGKPINSNNKHRTSCKECKEKYPFKKSEEHEPPFVRQNKIFGEGNWKKFGRKRND